MREFHGELAGGSSTLRLVSSGADARRLALAGEVMTFEYRQRRAGWLKVIPVAEVMHENRVLARMAKHASAVQLRRRLLGVFFAEHFYNWTPEDSPYSEFNAGPWRLCERAEAERVIEEIVAMSEAQIQQAAEQDARQRALAREGGHEPDPPRWGGRFADYAAMRRWYAELWPGPDVTWFVYRENASMTRAVAGVDDLLVGVAWYW